MLLRAFSKREKVLMLVLAAVLLMGFYVLAVHYPVVEALDQAAQEQGSLELDLQIAQLQYGKYQAMQEELDQVLARPADQVTLMPDYDNLRPLMNRLNQIFAPAVSYDMSFDPVAFEDPIARRVIHITFTCGDYAGVRSILEQLCHTGWRCLISDLALTTPQNDGDLAHSPVIATITITFFERIPA